MSVGPMEIVLVLVIALLVFGPNRLPQAGRSLGQAIREFRRLADTARSELGLDDVVDSIKGVKDDLSLDLKQSGAADAIGDLKSSLTIDLKSSGPAVRPAAAVDKPVLVAVPAPDDAAWPAAAATASPPDNDAWPASEASDENVPTGASAGRDDA